MQKSSNFQIEINQLVPNIYDENVSSFESSLLKEMKEFEEFKVWIKLKSEMKRIQSSSVSTKYESKFQSLSANQMNVSKDNIKSKPLKITNEKLQTQTQSHSHSPTKKARVVQSDKKFDSQNMQTNKDFQNQKQASEIEKNKSQEQNQLSFQNMNFKIAQKEPKSILKSSDQPLVKESLKIREKVEEKNNIETKIDFEKNIKIQSQKCRSKTPPSIKTQSDVSKQFKVISLFQNARDSKDLENILKQMLVSSLSKSGLVTKDCLASNKESDIDLCLLGIIKKMLSSIQMSDDQKNELINHMNEQILSSNHSKQNDSANLKTDEIKNIRKKDIHEIIEDINQFKTIEEILRTQIHELEQQNIQYQIYIQSLQSKIIEAEKEEQNLENLQIDKNQDHVSEKKIFNEYAEECQANEQEIKNESSFETIECEEVQDSEQTYNDCRQSENQNESSSNVKDSSCNQSNFEQGKNLSNAFMNEKSSSLKVNETISSNELFSQNKPKKNLREIIDNFKNEEPQPHKTEQHKRVVIVDRNSIEQANKHLASDFKIQKDVKKDLTQNFQRRENFQSYSNEDYQDFIQQNDKDYYCQYAIPEENSEYESCKEVANQEKKEISSCIIPKHHSQVRDYSETLSAQNSDYGVEIHNQKSECQYRVPQDHRVSQENSFEAKKSFTSESKNFTEKKDKKIIEEIIPQILEKELESAKKETSQNQNSNTGDCKQRVENLSKEALIYYQKFQKAIEDSNGQELSDLIFDADCDGLSHELDLKWYQSKAVILISKQE